MSAQKEDDGYEFFVPTNLAAPPPPGPDPIGSPKKLKNKKKSASRSESKSKSAKTPKNGGKGGKDKKNSKYDKKPKKNGKGGKSEMKNVKDKEISLTGVKIQLVVSVLMFLISVILIVAIPTMSRFLRSYRESSDDWKKKRIVINDKKFDDFFAKLSQNPVVSLKFLGITPEIQVILKSKRTMVLTFSDSIMKLKRNTAWTKIEDGKTEKELISKYFQIIVDKSEGFLKSIDIESKNNFPFATTSIKNCRSLENLSIFHRGEKINSTQCGFLDQDTILSITGRISIHGVSVDGEILKLKEMKAKKITFRHITGHLLHREIFKYFIDFEVGNVENIPEIVDFEMDIRTIAELQKEMHSDYEDEEEDYDYDYEELKENKDIKCLLKELRRNYNGLPFQDHFEISNETHKIKVECERNSFTMSQI